MTPIVDTLFKWNPGDSGLVGPIAWDPELQTSFRAAVQAKDIEAAWQVWHTATCGPCPYISKQSHWGGWCEDDSRGDIALLFAQVRKHQARYTPEDDDIAEQKLSELAI